MGNQIELIRKEIERRNLANYCGTAEQYEEELFAILDTLQEQPVEGLEEEIERYCGPYNKRPVPDFIATAARHFAEWGAEHLKK